MTAVITTFRDIIGNQDQASPLAVAITTALNEGKLSVITDGNEPDQYRIDGANVGKIIVKSYEIDDIADALSDALEQFDEMPVLVSTDVRMQAVADSVGLYFAWGE